MDEMITSKEVSELLKTPIAYIRKMIREQKLIAYKIGRDYKIKIKDLVKFLEEDCKYVKKK